MTTSKDVPAPKPKRLRRLAVGCALTLGMLLALAAVGAVLTLRVVEQRWERSMHEALAAATGDEIGFEDLQLGLTSTSITGIRVQDSAGKPVLEIRQVDLGLSPWAMSREQWQVDWVLLEGVVVDLHRDEDRWGLPETTLAMVGEHDLRQLPWPELRLGVLDVQDLTVKLQGNGDAVSVSIPSLAVAGLGVGIAEQVELSLGPVVIPELGASAPAGETVTLTGLGISLEPWTLGEPTLGVSSLQIEGVASELGAGGWRLPDLVAEALDGAEGIPWPQVAVQELALASLSLAAGSSGERAHARVTSISLGPTTLTIAPTPTLAWGPVTSGSVALSRDGEELVRLGGLSIGEGSIDRSATSVAVPWVSVRGLTATLRKGERWFAVPTGTWAIFGRPDAPAAWSGLRVSSVKLDGLDAQIVAPSGTLGLTSTGGDASGVGLDPTASRPWRVTSATLNGLTIREDEPFATVKQVQLSEAGVLTADGVELWTRLRKNRTIKLPPVVRDHAPAWIGGELEGDGTWFGVDLGTLPWQPKQARLRGAIIHLDDARNADPPLQWTVALSSASLGPMTKERLPLSAAGTVAEGSFEASGGLYANGKVVVNVAAKQVSLKALTPYVDDLLDSFGLKVKAGTVGGDLKIALRGSRLKITGPARARKIELGGNNKTAGLANAALQAVTGKRTRVDLELDVGGDLSDASYSPFRMVLGAVVGDLVGEAADTLGAFLEGIEIETDSSGKKGKKKKGNQTQAQQALESIASELQGALTGGNNNSGSKKKKNSGSGSNSGSKKKTK